MKRILLALLLGSAASFPVLAVDMPPQAVSNGCAACHAIDHKVVGPAWKDVAAKYRGNKAAEAKLIDKVTHGGAGVWGPVPMPPNDKVAAKDIKFLVHFILALK